jgi:hypothetical protein
MYQRAALAVSGQQSAANYKTEIIFLKINILNNPKMIVMKTKTFTIGISIMAIICLFLSGTAMSQQAGKKLSGSELYEFMMKGDHKTSGHFDALPGRSCETRLPMKKSMVNAAYRADTLVRYAINGSSDRTLNTYDNNGNLLNTLVQVRIIDNWTNDNQFTNVYDVSGNLLTANTQQYRGNAWVENNAQAYTYDEAGNCLTSLNQWWDGTVWNNDMFTTYTYDGSGNMLTALYEQWDGTAWMYAELDSLTYDGAGNLLLKLYQAWDGAAWSYALIDSWTYDESGNMLTFLNQWWDGLIWTNNYLQTNTYDGNGNHLTQLEQMWDGAEAWMNYNLFTWTYDAINNPLSLVALTSYDGVTWSNMSKNDWTYDATGNTLTFTISLEDYATGGWKNYTNSEYSYQDGVITVDGSQWFELTSVWTIGDTYFPVTVYEDGNSTELFSSGPAVRALVYYSSVTAGIKDPEGEDQSGSFSVHPNPANSSLTIIHANPDVQIEQLQIFDLSGKEQQVNLTGNQVDISKLQNGFYLLKLTSSDGLSETKKIVKQ